MLSFFVLFRPYLILPLVILALPLLTCPAPSHLLCALPTLSWWHLSVLFCYYLKILCFFLYMLLLFFLCLVTIDRLFLCHFFFLFFFLGRQPLIHMPIIGAARGPSGPGTKDTSSQASLSPLSAVIFTTLVSDFCLFFSLPSLACHSVLPQL